MAGPFYWVGGTGLTSDATNHWATTSGGAPNVANVPDATSDVHFDANSNTSNAAYSCSISVGFACLSFLVDAKPGDGAGGFPTIAGSGAWTISGNLTKLAGMGWTYTGTCTFNATSGTQAITSAGVAWDSSIVFNGVGGTFQLADNLTNSSTKPVTLTNGTLDLNGKTLSTGSFSSSNANTRNITSGGGGITVTDNSATVVTLNTLTNFTLTGALTFSCTYSGGTGTRTINCGVTNGSETNVPSINITAGTDSVTFTSNGKVMSVDFTGFAGNWNGSVRTLFGNLTLSTGMTLSASNSLTFAATSGTKIITSNGKTMDFDLSFGGGATYQLADALDIGATQTLTITAGTIDCNGKALNRGGSAQFTNPAGGGALNPINGLIVAR